MIGQAIARRISAGKKVLLADLRLENADAAAKTLSDAGFDVATAVVDVSLRNSIVVVIWRIPVVSCHFCQQKLGVRKKAPSSSRFY
jgi:NAD(P)-dependent dehydrogenase (short-subunit alcohol dehydrogenase family)